MLQCQVSRHDDLCPYHTVVLSPRPYSLAILQAQKLPDFNILCEKCAFEGMTRFEDRFKQPLGISVNFTSYAARLLTQARCLFVVCSILLQSCSAWRYCWRWMYRKLGICSTTSSLQMQQDRLCTTRRGRAPECM